MIILYLVPFQDHPALGKRVTVLPLGTNDWGLNSQGHDPGGMGETALLGAHAILSKAEKHDVPTV